ncbi:multidrug efflux MFS transporter [Staphylococcus simiae]|uniref:MDR family MFS transporter n=1 Tax=Staphylococcus simiae TaxID=308354 RepID=UPI001A976BFA|nr:MDR family MFS transporter [Staphylococcus simiae]MBO1198402.1 multidrug efflux MFS transporter [Staphylococcus simiae]MBO1200596.1 multidrug efflux MFS transporter [Staphylococcus simiae]MBO1202867.1 multidrug efflux MFS transporter [Staphylococcus simiae]MBO1210394.1 multidrug efflux MFS transporter [Staphylococcus simiae]MBO1228933.1 multidrug efflux MFS transporter [Staphylococcus simiae]
MTSKNLNIDIHGQQYKPTMIMSIILLATFAGALMQTSLGTALPTLMSDFNIDFSTAQQATTWFLLANGIMVPLSAFLATKVSTKWLHVCSYGVLLLGLVLTAIAPSHHDAWIIFLIGRIVTAIAVGLMMPLMQIIIINMYPSNKRGTAMGLSGLAVGLAPAMGPTFAGWILDKNHTLLGITISDSWRNIFVLPIIIVAIAFVLSFFFMKDIIPNRKIKLDVYSLILSCIGFGLFLWGFSNVSSEGWDSLNYVILPIIISVIVLSLFVLRQFKSKDPFLDLGVFKSKGFTIATIGLIVVTMAMYGVEMMLPTYLQNIHGFSPFKSGLTLLAGALMLGLISPISGALYNKVGIKRLAFVGFSILTLSSIPFGFLTDNTSPTLILVFYAIRMFGVAILMMPLTTNAMDALSVEQGTHGTAVNNTARQVASSIAVALLTSVTQNIINNNMPSSNLKNVNPLEYAKLAQQASIDGFNTAFIVGIVFALVGVLIVPFLKMTSLESEDK